MASPEGVSVQTVKLKVLYTFDAESRDNHLARWPHSLEVNTCFIDNSSQIGVVDLRTCLEAVITASPELTSRVDQDYAVYAYDYSEEDTPLVGQGMLSKTLAMQDDSLEQDNEAMITGKIAKSMMGLLSKNAQPTLEVKLRFKPVTVAPGQRMRSGSISSQDGRPAWLQSDSNLSQSQPRPVSPLDTTGLETMQRMLSEGGPPRERTASMAPESYNHSRPASRAGTPSLVQNHNPAQRQPADTHSRPSSRIGMRPQSHARRDSFNSGYYSGEENVEEGPARKRAKPSKVDWPTKSSFNIERQPDSLRVAASTAQSVRIHRPIAINPALMLQTGNLSEEPVRPPTPIPTGNAVKARGSRPRRIAPSNLAPGAHAQNPPLNVPPQSDAMDTAVSSPEEARPRSVSSTPANIPSSPPIMHEQPGRLITSPSLPPMPMNHDSGFMSGNLEDLFDDGNMIHFDDFIMEKPEIQQPDLSFNPAEIQMGDQQYAPVFEEENEVEASQVEPAPAQNQKVPIPPPPPRPMSRSQSLAPATRVGLSSPKLAPAPIPRARQIMEEQRAKGLLPRLPASEPSGRGLQRANTWAPDNSDALMSEAPNGDEQKPKTKKKVGKEQTKARLENAIAAGEMPPYCDNCGAIETPAWRRGYAKLFHCNWADVETSLGHGGVVFKEIKSRNPDGSIKTFRGYKTDKIPGDEDDGWEQICLCNPCGLWFHKQKCPRPKEKWQKNAQGKGKRKRGPKGPKGQKKPNGPANAKSDAPTPMSDESSPADTATEAPDFYDNDNDPDDTNTGEEETTDSSEPQLPPMPQNMRANSAEPVARGFSKGQPNARPAFRQVQSSPGHPHGFEGQPTDVDLTPNPIRRQLFRSPNKPQIRSDPTGTTAAAKGPANLPNFVRRSPRLNKTKNIVPIPGVVGAVAVTADGKENIVPELVIEDSFEALFEASIDDHPLPPSTPTPTRRSERLSAKTPQRQFGIETSPNLQRTPTFRTPKPKNGQYPVTAALLGTAVAKKDFSQMTPFTRAIEETLNSGYELGLLTPPSKKGLKKSTPGKNNMFDFPDLPSLNNSSPMNSDPMFNINLSELPTEHLTEMNDPFSTDAPVPSSPPGFFTFINTDGIMEDNIDWESITDTRAVPESVYPDPEAMSMAPPPSQALRRSPRKNK